MILLKKRTASKAKITKNFGQMKTILFCGIGRKGFRMKRGRKKWIRENTIENDN